MKKLVCAFAAAAMLLTGCGSSDDSTPKNETKTCKMDMSSEGLDTSIDVKFDATDDIVKKMEMSLLMPSDLMNGLDVTTLTEEQMGVLSDAVLAGMNIKKGEGVEVTSKVEGKDLKVSVVFDFEKASSDVIEQMGFGKADDMKLSDIIKESKSTDFVTCE